MMCDVGGGDTDVNIGVKGVGKLLLSRWKMTWSTCHMCDGH